VSDDAFEKGLRMDAFANLPSDLPLIEREPAPHDQRWRLALCLAIVLLGGLVMIGWLAGIEPLKSLVPGLSTMKFNTALGFVLTGAGLWLAGYDIRPARTAACAMSAALILITTATLVEYAWSIDFGLDQAIVADTGNLLGSGHPGRMSILTATAFLALGAAIALLSVGRRRLPILAAHAFGSYAAVVSVLAAAGYTFGAGALRGIGFYTYIAVHTAVGLMIAAAAVLLTRAEEGWLQPFVRSPRARALLVRLLPLSIGAPLLVGLLLLLVAGLGAFNAAYAFALSIPATCLTMVLIALWVAGRQRAGELLQLRYEHHLQLVAAEMNHRVKNTLAIVQSIAHQSLKNPQSVEAAKAAFDGRLMALAAAHDMLTRENWAAVSIGDVASAALSPHALCGSRIVIEGPPIVLGPKACVTLAMTFHELTTNAVKYGALSAPGGRIDVSWACDPDQLRLAWRERDGPPCAPAVHEGFGTRMLRRALASELGGAATLSFEREGFEFELTAPSPVHGYDFTHSQMPAFA
jgi:two-component sensor histidine kinase